MTAKKKETKNFLQKELHPDTESVAIGSALSIVVALFFKSLLVAVPVGLIIALAHKHGLSKKKK